MSVAEFPATAFSPAAPAIRAARPTHLDHAARGAVAAAVASVPPITLLHLSATDPIEPSGWTISDYVVSLPHGTLLFALTTGALAIGAGALAHGLGPVPGTGRIRALLGVWAAGLLIAAVFPTNLRGTPQDVSSNIHLYAGGGRVRDAADRRLAAGQAAAPGHRSPGTGRARPRCSAASALVRRPAVGGADRQPAARGVRHERPDAAAGNPAAGRRCGADRAAGGGGHRRAAVPARARAPSHPGDAWTPWQGGCWADGPNGWRLGDDPGTGPCPARPGRGPGHRRW